MRRERKDCGIRFLARLLVTSVALIGGIWEVYSSIGYQTSAELHVALV